MREEAIGIVADDATESELSGKVVRVDSIVSSKVLQEARRSAETAKMFFDIIFDVENNPRAAAKLRKFLEDPSLESSRFSNHCVKKALERIKGFRTKTDAWSCDDKGNLVQRDITDEVLRKNREDVTKIWPLVHAVTISTGSVLLNSGIEFFDLPGMCSAPSCIDNLADNNR